MEAILYICHGSRVKKASEQAVHFIHQCIENNTYSGIQEYAFLELSKPTIEEGFRQCITKGATTIKVIPVLLLTAAHAKKDIPEILIEMSKVYPSIDIKYGRPIGVHEKMIKIVVEKIKKATLYEAGNKKTRILLVGRGSSDPDVPRDLTRISRLIEEQLSEIHVKDCYLTAAKPSFEDALKESHESSYQRIIVIPYLLFTGILMQSMEKRIEALPPSTKQYELTSYLGYHPFIAEVLTERATEMIKEDSYVAING